MKNNTTPPKPTIREKLPKIPKKMLDCGGKTDKCLLEGQNTACMKHLNKWYAEISGTSSPQTGEGEMKKAVQEAAEKSTQEQVDILREAGYFPPLSEEMEKEFDKEFPNPKDDMVEGMDKLVLAKREKVKAFLRKQLDLQEKRYEKIMDDLDLMLAIGESVEDAETAKIFKNIRAELRSKLLQKEELPISKK